VPIVVSVLPRSASPVMFTARLDQAHYSSTAHAWAAALENRQAVPEDKSVPVWKDGQTAREDITHRTR
jgi:hypothetical protein